MSAFEQHYAAAKFDVIRCANGEYSSGLTRLLEQAWDAATLAERERQVAVLLGLQALPSLSPSERLLLELCVMAIREAVKS